MSKKTDIKQMATDVMRELETQGRATVPRQQIEPILAALSGMEAHASTTVKHYVGPNAYTSSTIYIRSDSGYILAIQAPRYSDGDLTVDLYLNHLTPQAYARMLGK